MFFLIWLTNSQNMAQDTRPEKKGILNKDFWIFKTLKEIKSYLLIYFLNDQFLEIATLPEIPWLMVTTDTEMGKINGSIWSVEVWKCLPPIPQQFYCAL